MSAAAIAAIAPLGSEVDFVSGEARRGRFAQVWSAVKGAAKAAFTRENARNMAIGGTTMFVARSAACAVAGACALPTLSVALSGAAAGGIAAAGFSYYKERRAAKLEGREADAFWSDSNRRRMAVAAGMSILGGSLVAAYQNGLFTPLTEKIVELAAKVPSVSFSFFPAAHAAGFGDVSPGERELLSAPPRSVAASVTAEQSVKATPVQAEKPGVIASTKSEAPVSAAAQPSEVVAKPTPAEKPAAPVDRPKVAAAAPVEAAASAAPASDPLARARELAQGNRKLEALVERAASSSQAEKDLAVALMRKDPALARALMESAAADGNRQAIRDLAWMNKNKIGLSGGGISAPSVAAAAAPAESPAPVRQSVAERMAQSREAAACHVSGTPGESDYELRCTIHDRFRPMIEPGEHIQITYENFPKVRTPFLNEHRTGIQQAIRWLHLNMHDVYNKAAGGMKALAGLQSQPVEVVANAAQKGLDRGFENM